MDIFMQLYTEYMLFSANTTMSSQAFPCCIKAKPSNFGVPNHEWEDDVKKVWWCGLDSISSGPMTGCCEDGNEHLPRCIKGEGFRNQTWLSFSGRTLIHGKSQLIADGKAVPLTYLRNFMMFYHQARKWPLPHYTLDSYAINKQCNTKRKDFFKMCVVTSESYIQPRGSGISSFRSYNHKCSKIVNERGGRWVVVLRILPLPQTQMYSILNRNIGSGENITSEFVNQERNTKNCHCAVYEGVEAGETSLKWPSINIHWFCTLALTSVDCMLLKYLQHEKMSNICNESS